MFEHQKLDGETFRVMPASETFLNGEVLELRETIGAEKDPNRINRVQYSVAGERLVERCLPPQSVGDRWGYDNADAPWWSLVNNPPHAGLVADFNSSLGGKQRVALDTAHNVIALAAKGEEVIMDSGGEYTLTRASDSKELRAKSMLELRQAYYAG